MKLRGLDGHAWLHFQTILISFKKRSLYDIDIWKVSKFTAKVFVFFLFFTKKYMVYLLIYEHFDILLILDLLFRLTHLVVPEYCMSLGSTRASKFDVGLTIHVY